MVTLERQAKSRLVALTEDSRVLGYTDGRDPERFLRELGGRHNLTYQVRIYDVCPIETDDLDHYYDFEAKCLLQTEPDDGRDEEPPSNLRTHH
ncbi:MAG TPA: hypothetical protein VFE34_00570 [Dongiaceae bacterium]|jgi:hypothetical protein|nr:hypothetical protein [Dongiaceae bacterium]